MADKFTGIPTKKLNQLLASPQIRAQLQQRMDRALPRTRAIALQAGAVGFAESLRIETGVRPGKQARDGLQRPYARLVGDNTPEVRKRDRGAKLSRTQILRRGVING